MGNTHTILGFDPRGINNTTPQTTCFPDETARKTWFLRTGFALTGSDSGNTALRIEHARSRSLGRVCEEYTLRGESASDFVGTPNVARDIVEIVEASWRADGLSAEEARTKGLKYWGFSYGTALGATFAMMFPDRVDRLLLDGVVHLEDYYRGGWRRNLLDTKKAIHAFYEYCAASRECVFSPVYNSSSSSSPSSGETETTAADIESRLHSIFTSLSASPLPVLTPNTSPDWVTLDDVKNIVFLCLYQPLASFPILAHALLDLERGNATMLSQLLHTPFLPPRPPRCGLDDDADAKEDPNTGVEADSAILCSDGPVHAGASVEQIAAYVRHLEEQSEIVAGPWARIQLACVGQRIRARGLTPEFLDQESMVEAGGKRRKVDVKGEILFIGNDADPVTPIANARDMSNWFHPARVLRVKHGIGHCSWAVRSKCVESVIAGFFGGGHAETSADEMETDAEIVCDVDTVPFGRRVVEGLGMAEEEVEEERGAIHVPGMGKVVW